MRILSNHLPSQRPDLALWYSSWRAWLSPWRAWLSPWRASLSPWRASLSPWRARVVPVLILPLLIGCDPSISQDFSLLALETTNQDFNAASLITVGKFPVSLASADLDGDGDTDVVVVNRFQTVAPSSQPADTDAPGTISVLINSGGALSVSAEFSVGVLPGRIFADDLNGDGFADLALLNNQNKNISIFMNDGSGGFPTEQSPPFSFGGTGAQISLVDFDGLSPLALDVLISVPSTDGSLDPGFMMALVNDGSGNFTQVNISLANASFPPTPTRFVTGDWNGDGNLDIAVTDPPRNRVITLTGDGIGNFSVVSHAGDEFVNVGSSPFDIVAENFDAGGVLDLAVSNRLSGTLSILIGQGDGSFLQDTSPLTFVENSGRPERLLTGNFTPSGVDIIVVQRTGSRMTVFNGDGAGEFAQVELVTNSDPFAIAGGDFNTDGNSDFVTAESVLDVISIHAGGGNALFARTILGYDTDTNSPTVLDLNGDTFDDLLLLQPGMDRIVVLLNCHTVAGLAC